MARSERGGLSLTAAQIATAIGGRLVSGDPARAVDGFSIDTRTLTRGDLFFAIRGERFDGAWFTAAALEAGAAGVVTHDAAGVPARAGTVVIAVDDTTRALQALARHVRRASGARVVAITGSAGKTTTKEVTAELLATRYEVFRNRGNLNNHIGLPLSLLELRRRPEVAVVEFGMNHAGEISVLTAIADPDVRVWTNVGEAHLEFFASPDAIADAKAEILEGAKASTVLVANADDPRVMARAQRFQGRRVTFGIERDADVRAVDVRDRGIRGMSARLITNAGVHDLTVPLVGRGNLANVLAATAVALEFQVPLDVIVRRTGSLRPAARRGEVVTVGREIDVIDDSYNSNPTALARALGVIAQERDRRRVAVVGEMLELGERSVELHTRAGRAVAEAGIAVLLTVGRAPARALGEAAIAAGLAREAVHHFESSDEAAAAAVALVRPGDVVLVKGSRGIRTDVIVDRLKAELG